MRQKGVQSHKDLILKKHNPYLFFIFTSVSIFIAECVVMSFLPISSTMPLYMVIIIDSLLLTLLVFPILYIYLLRPMLLFIRKQKQSEEKYRTLIELANDAIFITDSENGVILDANKKASELLGLPVEQIIGMHQTQLHPEEESEYYRELFQRDVVKEKDILEELFVTHGDGRKIPVEISASVMDLGGKKVIQGIFRDITERKHLEESFMDQLHFLETLIDTIPSPLFYKDLNGVYLGCNKAFEAAMGFTKDEIVGKTVYDVAPKELADKYQEMDLTLFNQPGVQIYECPVKYGDGTIHDIIFNKATYIRSNGTLAGLVGIMTDVTKRKQAEQLLKKSEKRYRALYNNNPSMYFTLDKNGMVLSVNEFGAEQLGYTVEELVGQSVLKVFHQTDQKAVQENLTNCLKDPKEIGNWEFRKVCKDGRLIWVRETVRVIKKDEENVNVLVVCEDITDKKQAEEALQEKSQELGTLTKDLRTLSAQLSHEEELSRRRFARILHEQVGQNLAAIKIVCKDAIDEHAFDKPKMKKVISQILTTLEDTIYSTRELTSELYPVVLDSLGFIPAIGWLVDLVLKPSYIAVFTDIDELVERFPSEDKLSLFRIVQEAFHNIIKHASATEVDIELKKIDSSIQLIIEDNGVGCDLEKIKNDKDKGIGLMLIKERVLSLGGDFKVEHIPENGTKLIIEVPMKH